MGGETGPTAMLANSISKDIFKWFRWERIQLVDQNFLCVKQPKHAPKKTADHTHPVDVIFHYMDPYLNRRILLNTDLKSYGRESIKAAEVRKALKSLALTIECARVSTPWQTSYNLFVESAEVRGLLFVYNHDSEYDKDFYKIFDKPKKTKKDDPDATTEAVNTETIPLAEDMLIHIADPKLISYMTTIIADTQKLHHEGTFPRTNYFFHYPELKLHKTSGDKKNRPATIELISGPFFLIEHDEVTSLNDENEKNVSFPHGFVIYYNREGASPQEFMYLFDTLSNYQILDGDAEIRIRLAHHSPDSKVRSNFEKAINLYIQEWGFDKYKKERLSRIDLVIVDVQKRSFSQSNIGWERK